MNVADIQFRINELMEERGLTDYRVCKNSGLKYGTVKNMKYRKTMPKLETLEKICNGMDVSLSDFFLFMSKPNMEGTGYLSDYEIKLIQTSRSLSERHQERLMIYASALSDVQKDNTAPET